MAEVKPHAVKEYTFRQSRFKNVPVLPMRAIVVAPSGGGKTTLLCSLILDLYRGCWRRIYVFSPTALLDDAWKPVAEYCENELKQEEQCLYDEFDEAMLQKILQKHHRITSIAKQQGHTKLFGALCLIDDYADSPAVVRGSKSLHELYVRGRHAGLSCICSVQKYRVLAPIIRVNATDLIVFRLRSQAEQEAIVEENSAAYGRKATAAILDKATEEPYSFLWISLRATRKEDLFWLKFNARLIPRSAEH
jgi:Poxvirus A32 protein